jgi:two-component system, OmpR family, sensor histidine kinase KdpD
MNTIKPIGKYRYILYYLAAILANIIVTIPLFWLRSRLNISTVALIYLLPVLLSTISWGLVPGLLTGLTAFFLFNYFFITPYYTLRVHKAEDLTVLLIFIIVAFLISQLVGRVQKNLAAATKRELQSTRLYELSLALSRASTFQEIALVIANQIREAFQAEFVEVNAVFFGGETSHASVPGEGEPPPNKPVIVIPLQTPRAFWGEVHLWRQDEHFDATEERILRTFASQGALALERVELAQSETRSRVLEESDRMKTALLSSVSHELRTPLSTIKAAVTSILSGEVELGSEAAQDLLAAVDEETDQLNRLVGNLLDMSRIEAGALKPDLNWNELSEIVEGACHRMRHVLEGFQLTIDLPENLPLVPVDFMQIERVFTNLFSNSAKYAPPASEIRVKARVQNNQTMMIQVSNQGPPIPEDHLERIFDKFYRSTDASRITGTGLGLSICKGIIEAHNGRIWAENLPGRFAFNFTLPLTWKGKPPVAVESEL